MQNEQCYDKSMLTIEALGFKVYSSKLKEIQLEDTVTKTLNTISPNSYGISTKDPMFRKALHESDYLVLDGVYFGLASIFLKGKVIRKNQGPDVFYHFMARMEAIKGKIFFLGSSLATLEKIKEKASIEYPNLSVSNYSPPFKNEFNVQDNEQMIKKINSFEPDVLFIGMTCPKQEIWAQAHKKEIHAKLICSVGAVFDWYAGNQKEIHPLWWKLKLAWLKRTIDRPEILRRYPSIGIYFRDLFLAVIKLKRF